MFIMGTIFIIFFFGECASICYSVLKIFFDGVVDAIIDNQLKIAKLIIRIRTG